ncbi:MAG: MEDS domain-containing protein, partial [Anaerolineae bacterium]|nr:MEDS domain-containing protein [Anaerolineae bacterium]
MPEKRSVVNKPTATPEMRTSPYDMPRVIHTITDLEPGDHLCCLYETENEYRAILTAFLRHGLEHHEKVLCIVDAHTAESVLSFLQDAGLDTAAYLAQGQLDILGPDEVYMQEGRFDPTQMIARLQQKAEQASAEGYTALCVAGETTWALRELPDSERLIEYEVRLNTFLPGSRCRVLCQYDMRRFSPAVLLDILRTHPFVA